MLKQVLLSITILLALLAGLPSCKHKPYPVPAAGPDTITWGGFPNDVGRIFITKCATAGCHNQASYNLAGGLLLDTWEHLFDGGYNGAVAIPYSPSFSSMMYFINTPANGNTDPVAEPTMPNNGTPLSKTEYETIKNWLAKGAPDRNGNIPFATEPDSRQKIYMTMQGCDLLGVIDAQKRVLMRAIPIGKLPSIESAHSVHVSPDGRYAYVCFANGSYMQKIDTRTDSVVGEINIGQAAWNAFQISPDGSTIAVSDLSIGKFVVFNANTMSGATIYPGFNPLHGVAANASFDTFYVTALNSNYIYKFSRNGSYNEKIPIDGTDSTISGTGSNVANPHEVAFAPGNFSRYFVTCQNTNRINIIDTHTDTLIKSIPIGVFPQEMSFSKTRPYVFITCTEDTSYAGKLFKGSVYVINYETLELVKRIDGKFYQPHGLCVDDRNGLVYIASRNVNPDGPAPHHTSTCGGRNGYYHVIDLGSLQVFDKRYEVTPDPYVCDPRFK